MRTNHTTMADSGRGNPPRAERDDLWMTPMSERDVFELLLMHVCLCLVLCCGAVRGAYFMTPLSPLLHLLRATTYATQLYSIHMPHGSEPPFQHIEEARRHNQLVPSADSVRE